MKNEFRAHKYQFDNNNEEYTLHYMNLCDL